MAQFMALPCTCLLAVTVAVAQRRAVQRSTAQTCTCLDLQPCASTRADRHAPTTCVVTGRVALRCPASPSTNRSHGSKCTCALWPWRANTGKGSIGDYAVGQAGRRQASSARIRVRGAAAPIKTRVTSRGMFLVYIEKPEGPKHSWARNVSLAHRSCGHCGGWHDHDAEGSVTAAQAMTRVTTARDGCAFLPLQPEIHLDHGVRGQKTGQDSVVLLRPGLADMMQRSIHERWRKGSWHHAPRVDRWPTRN